MKISHKNMPDESTHSQDEAPSKQDVKEKVKGKFIEWSQSSTSHGYPNIFRTKNIVVKIMWLIFFLAGLAVGIYMVVRGITLYLQYEVNTTIRRLKNESFVFPTVSICNVNAFVSDEGALYLLKFFQETYGSNITTVLEAREIAGADQYVVDLERLRQQAASPDFDITLRDSFGYTSEDMFWSCSFNTKECNYNAFERFYDPIYGNCFRFNSGINSSNDRVDLLESNRYSNEGFSVSIFSGPPRTNKSLLFYDIMGFSGIRIVIHDQKVKPYYSEGIFLQPGTHNRITINKVITENLAYPYSKCRDLTDFKSSLYDWIIASNVTYRQFDCFNLCYQKNVIEECGCYDVDVGPLFNAEPCTNSTQYQCLVSVYLVFKTETQVNSECESECPLECSSTVYAIEKSFATFPSLELAVDLQASDYLKNLTNQNNISLDYIQKSFLSLNILFADIEYTSITEQPSLTPIDLVANVGGTLGLFIGISLLSFLEMIEILIKIVSILLKNKFGSRTETYDVKV